MNGNYYVTGGPIFLKIEGQIIMSSLWIFDGNWIDLASEFKATCFILKHIRIWYFH